MNDQKLARAAAILADLVGFPTISARSNLDLIDYIRALLLNSGIESIHVFNEERTKANLVASIGPKNQAGGVLLSGHTDVVPVEGQAWSSDPFSLTERGGKFFGRGTCDMKGFIACVLAHLESLEHSALQSPLQMVFSFDEEVGCVGVRSVVENFSTLAARPSLIIIGEPTMMEPAIGHKGKIAGIMRCKGHECHSSDAPKGLNAIYLANEMITATRKLQEKIAQHPRPEEGFTIPYTTLHIGTIKGGTALNIVPADCMLEFEIRNSPSDPAKDVLNSLFDEAALVTERAKGRFSECGVTLEITNEYPGLLMREGEASLTTLQTLVGSQKAKKISFGTEGGLFHQALNVPTYICGPGDIAQAHRPDEFISRDQIAQCLGFLERLSHTLRA
jgi:acetylornithine deacetylase